MPRGGALKKFVAMSSLALLAAAGCGSGKGEADFTLKDLDGKEVSLSGFRGKAVLLHFWAVG